MKRIWKPYNEWEDYKNGMYNTTIKKSEKEIEDLSFKARDLLSDKMEFYNKAKEMLYKWTCAADVNLSIASRNRQSWVGQATCSYVHGIPEYITKYGWRLLSMTQQIEANEIADQIIELWVRDKCV